MNKNIDSFVHSSVESLQPLSVDVVSVQSQVVYGRVGNNIAMPILKSMGLTSASVPTVILSNTPHYSTISGEVLPASWFKGYLDDLHSRGALSHLNAVLTGFLGEPAQAKILGDWIVALIEKCPTINIIVDPVLGDHDHGEYVSAGIADSYLQHLLPFADELTPNCFELQRLTGCVITDMDSILHAAKTLLIGRTQWIVVKGVSDVSLTPNKISVVVMTHQEHRILTHIRIAISPKGTGDLFSAVLTASLIQGSSIFESSAMACESVIAALELSLRANSEELLLPNEFFYCYRRTKNEKR